jgi:hypothetical protein
MKVLVGGLDDWVKWRGIVVVVDYGDALSVVER